MKTNMKITLAKSIDVVEATVRAESNNPKRLQLVLKLDAPNGMPSWDDYLYDRVGCLYMGFFGHLVQYFAYSKPGNGYGGAKVRATMMSGDVEELIGPWSSRTGVINHGFRDFYSSCIDVITTTSSDIHAACSRNTITLNKAIDIVNAFYMPLKICSKLTQCNEKYYGNVAEDEYWFELDKEMINELT